MLYGGSAAAGRVGGRLRRALSREPLQHDWPMAPVAAIVFLGWLVMTSPWSLGYYTIPWDAKAHFLPQIQFLAQSIGRGESPFWAPFVFAGHPQIADPQAMIFSPPFLLLALVNRAPSAWAVDMTVFGMQLAAGLALAAWFRDRGWHWAGAIVAAIAFAFGASMAWRVQHTGQVLSLCYLPMILLSLDRALMLGSYRYGLATGVLGAALLLGRDQVALLTLYLLAAYLLWRLFTDQDAKALIVRAAAPLAAGGALAVALVAVPLVLTALLAAESNRPSIDLEGAGRGSLHPALLITALIPQVFGAAYRMEDYWGPPSFAWSDAGLYIAQNMGQIYIGAVPVLLVALALFQGRLWRPEIRFFTAAFAVMLGYALGWYTPVFRVFYEVFPGVSLYRRPADATFLLGGLSAVLTGYATHYVFTQPWHRESENAIAIVAGIVAVSFISALGMGLWLDRVGQLIGPLAIAATCLAVAAAAITYVKPRIALEPWPMALLLTGVTVGDLAYNNGPSTSSALPPQVYEAMAPDTRNETVRLLKARVAEAAADPSRTRRDRIELLGLGFHWPNVSLSHRLENTLGYNPIRLDLYTRATGAQDHIGLPDQRKFSPLLPSYRSPLVDMLGLKTIASGAPLESIDKGVAPGDFTLLARTPEAFVYDNPRALPRVMFATRSIGVSFEDILKSGTWPQFDPRETVLLEGSGTAIYATLAAASAAQRPKIMLERYRNTEVVVNVDSPRGGWVVLNDPWQRWWFAEIGGARAPVLRANVLFRAVEVPAGRHTVRFRFRPVLGAWRQLTAGAKSP